MDRKAETVGLLVKMEHEMVTIGPCKGLLEAVTLFGSKASVKRKLETCSPDIGAIWPKECLEFEGARCWTGTETSPYVSMSLSLSILSGQFPAIFHGQIGHRCSPSKYRFVPRQGLQELLREQQSIVAEQ